MEREGGERSWSERVEDLVEEGEIEKAISVIESQIQTLTTESSSNSTCQLDNNNLQLSSSLSDLAHLYSTIGLSLKAENARSRARDIKIALDSGQKNSAPSEATDWMPHTDGHVVKSESSKIVLPGEELPEDDWEALADLAPENLLSPQNLSDFSKPLLKEKIVEIGAPKRRGRGTFSYTAHGLQNNQQSDGLDINNLESKIAGHNSERDTTTTGVNYGTRHVVVLADFPPSTTTIDLEKLLKNFKNCGVVIRWVSDTVALAVFKSPTIALEVCNQIQCPFTVQVLEENDPLLKSIPPRDLEPPRERPKTSTSAATRLIAQGMGIKLPTRGFGSKELKKQEQARRDRIVSRQNMRDDAWGDDDV